MVEGNEKLDRGVLRPRGKCWGGRVRARGGQPQEEQEAEGAEGKEGPRRREGTGPAVTWGHRAEQHGCV